MAVASTKCISVPILMPTFSNYEGKCVLFAKINYGISQFQSFVFTNRYCKMAEKEISCDMKCNRCIISRSMSEYASIQIHIKNFLNMSHNTKSYKGRDLWVCQSLL